METLKPIPCNHNQAYIDGKFTAVTITSTSDNIKSPNMISFLEKISDQMHKQNAKEKIIRELRKKILGAQALDAINKYKSTMQSRDTNNKYEFVA